jgi:hypothetical protein
MEPGVGLEHEVRRGRLMADAIPRDRPVDDQADREQDRIQAHLPTLERPDRAW